MLMDGQMQFDPAGTAITVTAVSTNIIDLKGNSMSPTTNPGRDLGSGGPAGRLVVLVGTAFAAVGAATLNIQIQGAPDNGSGAPGAWTTYEGSGDIAKANLTAGARFEFAFPPRPIPTTAPPPAVANLPRFLRLNYVVTTGPFTAGTLQAQVAGGTDSPLGYVYPVLNSVNN